MTLDRIVEPEPAGVPLPHQRDAREELRDRADAVDRVGRSGPLRFDVGLSERAAPQHLLIVHDLRAQTRHPLVGAFGFEPRARQTHGLGDSRIADERPGRRSRGKADRGERHPDGAGNDLQGAPPGTRPTRNPFDPTAKIENGAA
jgi:hypothetical protein